MVAAPYTRESGHGHPVDLARPDPSMDRGSRRRMNATMSSRPEDARAFIRGLFVERFGRAVRSIGWNGIAFRHEDEDLLFDMNPLVESNVGALNDEMADAANLADVVSIIRR